MLSFFRKLVNKNREILGNRERERERELMMNLSSGLYLFKNLQTK